MKETNSLENQLRSWQPRRPSAGIRRRLFGAATRSLSKSAWLLGSLAPATACMVLTLSFMNSNGNIPAGSTRPQPLLVMIVSNENCAAYQAAGYEKSENNWSSVTFEWTKANNFTSSIAPFLR